MQKGYLPYLNTGQETRRDDPGSGVRLSFKFTQDQETQTLRKDQIDNLYRALEAYYVNAKRQPRPERPAARMVDAFYSLNIFPPRNIRKYLVKSGVRNSVAESLGADWRKVGLDLWSSVLNARNRSMADK